MTLLYGTGNPAKLAHMRGLLAGTGIDLIGLSDISGPIPAVPETGHTPLENARIKAHAYFNAFDMPVFSCDSGLYFEGAAAAHSPGVHVRTPCGAYLDDDAMRAYYSVMAAQHGPIRARYKNAVCLVTGACTSYESMDDALSGAVFLITQKPHAKRVPGFPLDSLSVDIAMGQYFYDLDNPAGENASMREGFRRFFHNSLCVADAVRCI